MRLLFCLALAGLTSLAAAADAPPEGDLARCLEIIRTIETETVAISATDKPLREVAEELASRMSVPLHVDWKELAGLSIQQHRPVSLKVGPVACSAALTSLCLVSGDVFDRPVVEVWGGQVLLTSSSAAAKLKLTAVYDVRDLLASGAWKQQLGGMIGGARPEEEKTPEAVKESESLELKMEAFVELLTETIDPDGWMSMGGDRAGLEAQDGLLVITAPAMTHWRVRQFLGQLRAANPSGYNVEAAIIDLPAASYDRLSRRNEPNSLALAQGIRTATEATLIWQTKGLVGRGKCMELKSTDGPSSVEFSLLPTFSAEQGQTSIKLDVRIVNDSGERTLKTQSALPGDLSCGVFQMPGAKADSQTMRLVVLVLRPL